MSETPTPAGHDAVLEEWEKACSEGLIPPEETDQEEAA